MAERGKVITVMDRGHAKAILGPLPGRLRIKEGIEEGWITPGSGTRPKGRRRFQATRSVAEMLAEDRGE